MTSLLNPAHLTLEIPRGYGLRVLSPDEAREAILSASLDDLMDKLLLWELPRRDQLYVLSADVSGGVGKDRSVIDVTRVETVEEPCEQVAQFVSATIDPVDLAGVCDVVGRFYTGSDGQEAVCAIEVNNHGLATQSELQRHWGYDNFFVWQYEDAADPRRRFSTRIGWVTSVKTRPLMIALYVKRVKSVDPTTGVPDYRINSPHTIEELADFQVPPDGQLWDAAADETNPDAHDDCIMAGAIGQQVVQKLVYDSSEPLSETRKRRAEEKRRQDEQAAEVGRARGWANTDVTVEEMLRGDWEDDDARQGWGIA